jgi:SAM-dependent methyltransferase
MKQWQHLDAQRILDDQIRSWWFQGKRTIVDALFSGQIPPAARVLDIGAGQGLFINHFVASGQLVALDDWPSCLMRNRQRGGIPVRGNAVHLPFADKKFDYLFALDVLEHLPDDRQTIQEWSRVLKPGGKLVLNIPAMECLWSHHDVQMGHYRRYHRSTLRPVLESNGFKILRMTYTNFFLFPVSWLVFRLRLHQSSEENPEAHLPLPRMIESCIRFYYRMESAWLRRWNLPCGASLIAIAEKNPT